MTPFSPATQLAQRPIPGICEVQPLISSLTDIKHAPGQRFPLGNRLPRPVSLPASVMTGLTIVRRCNSVTDWLESKMETDSPEPDHCPVQSPADLLPDGSRSNIILTPPSAFADSSLQGQQGTPEQQIHRTPAILQNCGGTYSIPGRLPLPSVSEDCGRSEDRRRSEDRGRFSRALSPVLETIHSDSDNSCAVTTESSCYSRGVRAETAVETTMMNMTSLLQRGTPSIMATSSMMNSLFGLPSPSSAPNSTRKTPVIMATDSVMGNSTFAIRSPCSVQQPNATQRTPCLLVTDSVMGNSTFGLQGLSSAVQSRPTSAQRTPTIFVTNSVMGNSTMMTPVTPLRPCTAERETDNLGTQADNLLNEKSEPHAKPSILSPESSVDVQSSMFPEANILSPTDSESYEQTMDTTPSPDSMTLDELAECWAHLQTLHLFYGQAFCGPALRRNRDDHQIIVLQEDTAGKNKWPLLIRLVRGASIPVEAQRLWTFVSETSDDVYTLSLNKAAMKRNNEHDLREELLKIKGQFFHLLNTLGLSHDIYYNAVTPAQTPKSVQLESLHTSLLTAANNLTLRQYQGSGKNVTASIRGKCERMSTPQSTPRRRNQSRQHGVDRSSKYADLVIEQLLAKARTDSSSSKSNSPPDPQSGTDHDAAPVPRLPDNHHHHHQHGHRLCDINVNNVNVNRGSGHIDTKNSAKCKVIPDFSGFGINDDGDPFLGRGLAGPSVSPDALLSNSSGATSSTGSSSNTSVPDLGKELVSRMQYYSDFTIDRQKKIDEAMVNLEMVSETSDEASPSDPPAIECSSDKISPRCVEGSESVDHFKAPLPVSRPPSDLTVKAVKSKNSRNKNVHSSDMNESDTSSGTGSLPRSKHSSRPSSQSSSKHSSRDRRTTRSSSGDHRSSSRGSRCSTHPLASSTLITDPSNNTSPSAGSVYTWSLDNSSDENLHQSFLRSEERRHHRHSRIRRRSKSSHGGNSSRGVTRPETVIGADSPPQDKLPSAGDTLHLTGEFSVINPRPLRFGGSRFENSVQSLSTPQFSSLPRTSTRIGGIMVNREDGLNQKAASSPELTTPCSDVDYGRGRSQQRQSGDKPSLPFRDRPDLPGKSSSCDSATSYHSQCLTCNPRLLVSPENASVAATEDPCDDILTNSPNSYDGSGLQPPYNSYMSPAGSSNDYTTVSNSSAEQSILASAPRQPQAFAVKSASVFKVPFSPASRTIKRKAGAGGHSTHNVGVRAIGTPHFPTGLFRHKDPASKRKLFATGQSQLSGAYHAPRILDRKALVRKFKKFSSNFKKDKDGAQIHTLANL
ncbi:hypothetical protein ACOMHN_014326 [Nucella lapillus]